jgi:hypothetical protein
VAEPHHRAAKGYLSSRTPQFVLQGAADLLEPVQPLATAACCRMMAEQQARDDPSATLRAMPNDVRWNQAVDRCAQLLPVLIKRRVRTVGQLAAVCLKENGLRLFCARADLPHEFGEAAARLILLLEAQVRLLRSCMENHPGLPFSEAMAVRAKEEEAFVAGKAGAPAAVMAKAALGRNRPPPRTHPRQHAHAEGETADSPSFRDPGAAQAAGDEGAEGVEVDIWAPKKAGVTNARLAAAAAVSVPKAPLRFLEAAPAAAAGGVRAAALSAYSADGGQWWAGGVRTPRVDRSANKVCRAYHARDVNWFSFIEGIARTKTQLRLKRGAVVFRAGDAPGALTPEEEGGQGGGRLAGESEGAMLERQQGAAALGAADGGGDDDNDDNDDDDDTKNGSGGCVYYLKYGEVKHQDKRGKRCPPGVVRKQGWFGRRAVVSGGDPSLPAEDAGGEARAETVVVDR